MTGTGTRAETAGGRAGPGELTPGARKILDAAARLFYERGITAVGVDLVAKEAGVTKKTLYDRFGSKEALVAAYLRERDERWRGWLTEWIADAGAPQQPEHARAYEQVLATFDALGAWTQANSRGCGFVNAAAELPDPGHPGRKAVVAQKRWLRALLRDLADRAGAREPGRLADELMLLHEGATVLDGLSVTPGPIASARSLAVLALARAGCTPPAAPA